MTKKPDVTTISNIETATTPINENFEAVRDAFDNTISRDGSTPNQMEADLDMNGNDVINVGTLNVADISVGGGDVTGVLERAEGAALEAEGSAAEAATSASEAALSAAQAALYEGSLDYETWDTLLADTVMTYTAAQPATVVAGDYVRVKERDRTLVVLASSATGYDAITDGGVKLAIEETPGAILAARALPDVKNSLPLNLLKRVPAYSFLANPTNATGEVIAAPAYAITEALGFTFDEYTGESWSLDIPIGEFTFVVKGGRTPVDSGTAVVNTYFDKAFPNARLSTVMTTPSTTPVRVITSTQNITGVDESEGFELTVNEWSGTNWVTPTRTILTTWLAFGY